MIDFEMATTFERAGKLMIGIDRVFARRLYLRVPLAEYESKTGESPYVEKAIAFGSAAAAIALLSGSIWLTISAGGWWSLLAVPLAVVFWLFFFLRSSVGGSSMAPAHVLVGLALVPVLSFGRSNKLAIAALSYALALWFARLVYASTSTFMRNLVMRNERAFNWLREGFQAWSSTEHEAKEQDEYRSENARIEDLLTKYKSLLDAGETEAKARLAVICELMMRSGRLGNQLAHLDDTSKEQEIAALFGPEVCTYDAYNLIAFIVAWENPSRYNYRLTVEQIRSGTHPQADLERRVAEIGSRIVS